jgi:hypothetical protein
LEGFLPFIGSASSSLMALFPFVRNGALARQITEGKWLHSRGNLEALKGFQKGSEIHALSWIKTTDFPAPRSPRKWTGFQATAKGKIPVAGGPCELPPKER